MAKLPMIILYVANQQRSRDFYKTVLNQEPVIDVPGMTEFKLTDSLLLGLMPETGIAKIICPASPDPQSGNGIPRCELYLIVENVDRSYHTAITTGAREISPPEKRNWGDRVAYCSDPDGHVIAFAQ